MRRHTAAFLTLLALAAVLLAACAPAAPPPPTQSPAPASAVQSPAPDPQSLEIVTLLPKDAIPAIDDPVFLTAAEANEFYDPDELVIGVAFGDEARAYSVPFLSGHEIVNDEAAGVKFAVTW
jgi:hypothetical protein